MEIDSSCILDSDICLTDQRKHRNEDDLNFLLSEPNTKKQHQSTDDSNEKIMYDWNILYDPLNPGHFDDDNSSNNNKKYIPIYDSDDDSEKPPIVVPTIEEVFQMRKNGVSFNVDDDVFPSSFARLRGFPQLKVSQDLWPEEYAYYESLANLAIVKYNHDNNLKGTHFEVVKVEQVNRRLSNYTDYYVTFTASDTKAAGVHEQDTALRTFQAILGVDVIEKTGTEVYLCRLKPN